LLITSLGGTYPTLVTDYDYRMNVIGNRIGGRMFGPERDEIIGGWRK
jgi:hypothetical protein